MKTRYFNLYDVLLFANDTALKVKNKLAFLVDKHFGRRFTEDVFFDVYGNFYFGAPIYVNYINKNETVKEVILIEDLKEYLYYHPLQNDLVIDFSKKGKEKRKIKKLIKSFIKKNNLDCTLK